MTRENRVVEKKDIIAADIYAKNRKLIRKKLVELKKKKKSSAWTICNILF